MATEMAAVRSRELGLAVGLSGGFFALRLATASGIGFGDAEALYACYALHPQPAYLDHPGLVGALARLIGAGGPPKPYAAHVVTSVVSTAVPWVGALAARAAGAGRDGAVRVALALMLLPELAIGLFGLTPDLPLALAWLSTLGFVAGALRADAAGDSGRARARWLAAGLALGLAVCAKVSGVLLGVALVATLASPVGRRSRRVSGPYLSLALALLVASPVGWWEHVHGYPLLGHRLVATQTEAGFSLRNVGALLGGQLLYVTPPFLVGAYVTARTLFRNRADGDPVTGWLLRAALVPAITLGGLCLWSRVAEPHWVAPAYLALAVELGRTNGTSRRLRRVCLGTGVAFALLGWAAVKTPLVMVVSGAGYSARYDVANDLHAYGPAASFVADAALLARIETGTTPVVVGPHWTVCAQVHQHLGPELPVGCLSPEGDDFQATWSPRAGWEDARTVLFVGDDRFDLTATEAFPTRTEVWRRALPVRRFDRVVRTVTITRLDRGEETARSSTSRDPRPGPMLGW